MSWRNKLAEYYHSLCDVHLTDMPVIIDRQPSKFWVSARDKNDDPAKAAFLKALDMDPNNTGAL